MTDEPQLPGVGLADALEGLRAELERAREKAAKSKLQFPIDSLTVELQVAVTRQKEGKVGFRVPMVGAELGGSGTFVRESLQTVTLTLGSPVDSQGRPIKVASAGDEMKG